MVGDPRKWQSDRLLQAFDFAADAAARDAEHHQQLRGLLLAVVGVMDSFDRVLCAQAPDGTVDRGDGPMQSVRLIAKQLEGVLSQAGVRQTPLAIGDSADPQRDEIVETRSTNGAEDDAIVEVVARGYDWNGQALRRPRVVVARHRQEG